MKQDKKYSYKILKEQNLLIKYYSGNLSLKEISEYVEYTWQDKDYLPTLSVLNDLRDCVINIENKVILDFIDKVKNTPSVYQKRKIVNLTNTPNQVVFSSMVNMLKKEPLFELSTVSTIESACNFLMIPEVDFDLIHQTLKELKKKV